MTTILIMIITIIVIRFNIDTYIRYIILTVITVIDIVRDRSSRIIIFSIAITIIIIIIISSSSSKIIIIIIVIFNIIIITFLFLFLPLLLSCFTILMGFVGFVHSNRNQLVKFTRYFFPCKHT